MADARPHPPAYFLVPRGAHFRFRWDLVEELCVAEHMSRTLPRTAAQLLAWRRLGGAAAARAELQDFTSIRSYTRTQRYLFQMGILEGETEPRALVTDRNGWVVCVEQRGLFQALLDRALAFAVHAGRAADASRLALNPRREPKPAPRRVMAPWAVGFERGTGLCVLLAQNEPEKLRTFLAGQTPWQAPSV